jgi:hypothetical protein
MESPGKLGISLTMGIFSRRPRVEKDSEKAQFLVSRLDEAKAAFFEHLHHLETSPYSDVSEWPVRSRPTPEHIQMDSMARKELMLFIKSFLEKDWAEVTKLHDEIEKQWRTLILDNLLISLRKFVPMAVNGTEQKIASLLAQGYELSLFSRAYYIQRDVSSSIDSIGDADSVKENDKVYKHAEYLLLKQIIEVLTLNYESKGRPWLQDASWYYSTLFCEYMKWSYSEGLFKNSSNNN